MRTPLAVRALLCSALLLAGCTAPRALDKDELAASSRGYWSSLQAGARDAGDALTLERAMAIAMRNNIEFRLRALEGAIATGNRQLATMSMLPTLTAQAGYRLRNNLSASSSQNIYTGAVSLASSTSTERELQTTTLSASWNFLDFGLQYFRAREYGEQALIAQEERRRMMQDIAREVVYYWWMARGHDAIRPDLEATRVALEEALRQSEEIAEKRLRDPVEVLEYRKALFLIMKRLDRLVLDMSQARNELARLLNLPAGMPLQLAGDEVPLSNLRLPAGSLEAWQMAALVHRPELRQAQYRTRIAGHQARAFWLEVLPAPQLGYGLYSDSNRFLVHNDWQEFSAQLSLNLLRLAAAPSARKLRRLNQEMAQEREKLQATAVLSQVAVAVNAVRHADHSFCVSRNLANVDNSRIELLRSRQATATLDRLSFIRARVDNLLLRAEQVTDEADYHRARSLLLGSVGVGIVPDAFRSGEVDAVAQDLRAWWASGLSAHMDQVMAEARERVAQVQAPAAATAPALTLDSAGAEGETTSPAPVPDALNAEESELCL